MCINFYKSVKHSYNRGSSEGYRKKDWGENLFYIIEPFYREIILIEWK